jgi:formate dehydrogenase major subunit
MDGIKGLIIFGEDPADVDFSGLEFLGVSDIYLTETAKQADVVIPGTGFASTDGTYTNTERRLMDVEAAIEEDVDFCNWEIAAELAHGFEVEFPFEEEWDISEEMNDTVPMYKYAETEEVLGGVFKPYEPKFAAAEDAPLVDVLPCTDALMNIMTERIPDAVK